MSIDQEMQHRRPAIGPNRSFAMHGDHAWQSLHWYERPREAPELPEVYTYTDRMSYSPGEEVCFHSSTYAAEWTLEIIRDGDKPQTVHKAEGLSGSFNPTPHDAYARGCRWPVSYRWTIPAAWKSGFYLVVSSCLRKDGTRFVQHHFFVVLAAQRAANDFLLILPTSTWTAYNDWGGANHYRGISGPDKNDMSPMLSTERPWTKGIVWLPKGAPRVNVGARPAPGDMPRYLTKEWALANGFGHYYGSAGWAQFDRHFVVWAEQEGFDFDVATQTDLHFRPEILERYRCVVFVGHDEYWTAEMRLAVDAFMEAGGRVARFAGNFLWQIRLENDGTTQICYKHKASEHDPVAGTERKHLLTTAWEHHLVDWPGARTFGVNALRGMYATWGGFSPGGSGGFTLYRPSHWAFKGTGLRYGDVLGATSGVFSYEVDGLDYTFRDGLPYPTGLDGATKQTEILALTPAALAEDRLDDEAHRYYIEDSDLALRVEALDGQVTTEGMRKHRYGCGVIVHMPKGSGEVFCAGSCEWIAGLIKRDEQVQKITRNVIARYSDKSD